MSETNKIQIFKKISLGLNLPKAERRTNNWITGSCSSYVHLRHGIVRLIKFDTQHYNQVCLKYDRTDIPQLKRKLCIQVVKQ